MRLLDERLVALGLIAALSACGGHKQERPEQPAATPVLGPAADYPMVLGAPFTIDGKLYTPADTLNYDEVGYASLDSEGGTGISVAHRTLPLPSYVEITSLETGRTILARAERRGPMTGPQLVALSPGASAQLGAGQNTPVRVRRVNPPEQERAFLRRGERAAERMETPMTLVAVLKRKLPASPVAANAPEPTPQAPNAPVMLPAEQATAPRTPAPPVSVSGAAIQPSGKGPYVQAGAFSSKANAQKVASAIGGKVVRTGKYYAARTGPFANRGLAEASLAKVKRAGYSEARIFSAN